MKRIPIKENCLENSDLHFSKKSKKDTIKPTSDDIKLEEEIGSGADGTVYKATWTGDHGVRRVAVKRIRLSSHEKDASDKMINELRVLSKADHPNIVKLYTEISGHHDDGFRLVLELMDQDLLQYLNRNKNNISLDKQINICFQIASGLEYLHNMQPHPILHRDLYPKNVLLSEDTSRVKISDFGRAKWRLFSGVYMTTHAPGCNFFMPPEALTEQPNFSRKSDVFSFGLIMIMIASQSCTICQDQTRIGTIPEVIRRKGDLEKVPNEHPLKPMILKCLKDECDRPDIQSLREILQKLEEGNPHTAQFVRSCLTSTTEDFASDLLDDGNRIQSTMCAEMPKAFVHASAVKLGDNIYICGYSSPGSLKRKDVAQILIYNLKNKEWSEEEGPQQIWCQAAAVNQQLTLIGGLDLSDSGRICNKLITLTDKGWKELFPHMNESRLRPGVLSLDDILIVAGGKGFNGEFSSSIEILDCLGKQWFMVHQVSLPKAMWFLQLFICKDEIYLYDTGGLLWKMQEEELRRFITPSPSASTTAKWTSISDPPKKASFPSKCAIPIAIGGCRLPICPTKDICILKDQKWKAVGQCKFVRLQSSMTCVTNQSLLILGGIKEWPWRNDISRSTPHNTHNTLEEVAICS